MERPLGYGLLLVAALIGSYLAFDTGPGWLGIVLLLAGAFFAARLIQLIKR